MKFLLIGPTRFRSTDGVIVEGIKNIIYNIYGKNDTQIKYQILSDSFPMSDEDIFTDYSCDGIFVCGTPWLWDRFQNSTKYSNLQKIFSLYQQTPKVFMGIGSCLSLNLLDIEHDILSREDEVKGIVDLFSNTTIITRDSLAHKHIINAGLISHQLPCPAYFAYGLNRQQSSQENNILVWCDPSYTISSIDWHNKKEALQKFYDVCSAFYKQYNPMVYCSEVNDIPMAQKLGFDIHRLTSYKETLDIMRKARYVLSGRVHYGVPAFVNGCKLGIMPIDSRHLVLSEWGCPIIKNPDEIHNLSECFLDLDKYYMAYKNILNNVIPL